MRLVVTGLLGGGRSRHKVVGHTSTEKNNGMQDSQTDPLAIFSSSSSFLIENKDSDIEPSPPAEQIRIEQQWRFNSTAAAFPKRAASEDRIQLTFTFFSSSTPFLSLQTDVLLI